MRLFQVLTILCAFAQICWANDNHNDRPTLIFESVVRVDSEMGQGLIDAETKVLKSLGYQLKAIDFPARRGLEEIKFGRVDGTLGRIGNLTSILGVSDIVRVDVPLMSLKVTRWCRKELEKIQPPKKLKVGYRLGAVIIMMLVDQMDMNRLRVQEIRDQRSSVQMLSSNRLDCLLSNELVLATEGVVPDDLKPFDRFDIMTVHVYPWISNRHRHLKSAMEAGLRTYPFPDSYRKKFLSDPPVCDGLFDVLCPDGIIFHQKIDFRSHGPT